MAPQLRHLFLIFMCLASARAQTFINSNKAETFGPVTGLGVAVASTAAGRLLIVGVEAFGGGNSGCSAVTDTQLNVWVRANRVHDSGTDETVDLWYAENIAGTGTDTVTCSTGGISVGTMAVFAAQYSGVAVSGSLDRTTVAIGSGQSASSGNTVPTTQASELIVGFIAWDDCGSSGFGVPVAGLPFVSREVSDCSVSDENILQDKTVSITGVQAATATAAHATDTAWLAIVATFRATPPVITMATGYTPAQALGCSFFAEGDDIGATAHTIASKCGNGVSNVATAVNSDFTKDTSFVGGHGGIQGDGTRYGTLSRNDLPRTFLYIGRINDQVFNSGNWCAFWANASGVTASVSMCPQQAGFGAKFTATLPNDGTLPSITSGTVPNGGPPAMITGSITGSGPWTLTLRINRVTVASQTIAGSLPTITSAGIFAGYSGGIVNPLKGAAQALYLGTTGFDPAGSDMANLETWGEAKYFPGFSVPHQFIYCGFDSVYTQFSECQYSDDMVNYTRQQVSSAAFGSNASHTERDDDYFAYQGKWWKVHTNSQASPNPERYFGLDVSADMIGGLYTHVKDIACPNPGGSVECWAPSHFIDEDGSLHIFATVGHDGTAHAPYEFHPTTSDLASTWSAGAAITLSGAPSADNIDAFNIKIGSTYYMLLKDYAGGSTSIYSAATLTGTYSKGLQIVPSGYEGPSMCQKPAGGWRVFLDQGFHTQWYQDLTQDLTAKVGSVTANTMNDSTGSSVTYPFYATGYNEHGTCQTLAPPLTVSGGN
jgi:hypothetical protein